MAKTTTKTTKTPKKQTGVIYQLKITLEDSNPSIWRRIEVPGKISLGNLADILLDTMGWEHSHLHQFIVDGKFYSSPSPYEMENTLNEDNYTLQNILPNVKSKCRFEYDFGDSWLHTIVVEKIVEPEAGAKYPRCTDGKMACPPEDCGGIWGYMNLIDILKNPKHPEHETYLEWLCLESSEDFDPTAFSVDEVNKRL